MKIFRFFILCVFVGMLSSCYGWDEYMKFTPNSQVLWSKEGISKDQKDADIQSCEIFRREHTTTDTKPVTYFKEICMLEKGYTFTNARPPDTLDYCRKDKFGGGPACKSIGQ